MVVVAVEPGREQAAALLIAPIASAVGPLVEQGAVEALHLAVNPGGVGRREQVAGAQLGQGGLEVARGPVVAGVVGHDPLELNAVVGEELGGSEQEGGAGGAPLVGQDLAIGEAAVIVDQGVDEVVARARPAARSPLTTVAAPAAA